MLLALVLALGCGDKDEPVDDSGDAGAARCAESAADLPGCVQVERYQADLEWIAAPRLPGSDHWQEVQDRCAETFTELGMEVELHVYETGVNVIGRMVGATAPDELVLMTAHYDHITGCDGADDNASGVAGLLESARVLAEGRTDRTVVFACWDEEERGLIGSQAWAAEARSRGDDIVTVFNYEMIGYATEEPYSQELPVGFDLLFPDETQQVVDDEYRGDFLAVIADEASATAGAALATHGAALDLDVLVLAVPDNLLTSPAAADLQRSDHASFWVEGYPAMMLTDTSEFRYSAYHCGDGEDAVDKLVPDFSRKVVGATVGAVGEVAGWQ